MPGQPENTMATSDDNATLHTSERSNDSSVPNNISPPNASMESELPIDSVVVSNDDPVSSSKQLQSHVDRKERTVRTGDRDDRLEETEDMVVVMEKQRRAPSFSSHEAGGMSSTDPSPLVHSESGAELNQPRAETDASLSGGGPSVDVSSPTTEVLSSLQEFLSSPHGNSQICERSPGGRYVRFMEKLGSGASKDVYRAYDTEEGIEVAWNVVHLAGVPKNERNRIVNEVRLLERLHHQNIISFHGSWVNRERQQVNFVTEILSSGTLKSFINKVQVIRWKIAKRWALQILKGLEYLHSQDPPVIHRDLKCENIFINGTSGDLRIGDLGLSTVHRNGRVLSVLGTPEFMAPDMYEEGSYDEKVDIYAFGMCLLEIFTKEIPYRECNNPAQIYKKVMGGSPPDSLARLKSAHAREFIELCMGYKNEIGKYVRPSATELLDHPFLIKRANDDDEVEVEPLLQEQPIREASGSMEYGSDGNTSKGNASGAPSSLNMNVPGQGSSTKLRQNTRATWPVEEDESDRFEEMPDSEVNNIRKVKVLMGRGEELKEMDEASEENRPKIHPVSEEVASVSSNQKLQLNEAEASKLHYLVAAAVIEENEQAQIQQPYPDDVLKLVVTLPVEGQTQNVQFDFHLVEDDPIQVAKEMVAELGIPQGAVLEISETISSLARAARTKKHKFLTVQAQRAHDHQSHSSSQSQSIGSPPGNIQQLPPPSQGQGNAQHHQLQPQHISPHPVQEYAPPTQQHQQLQSGQEQHFQQQSMQQQGISFPDHSLHLHGQSMGQSTTISSQIHQMQHHGNSNGADPDSRPPPPSYGQIGIQNHAPPQPPNSNHQPQGGGVNGEYHHSLSHDGKLHQAPDYSHLQPPPALSTRNISNANPQSVPSQAPVHSQGGQNSNHTNMEVHPNAPGNSYAAAPQTHVQQMSSPSPADFLIGAQHSSNTYQPSQHHDISNQQAQYQYNQQQSHVQHGGNHQAQQPQHPHQQQFQSTNHGLAQGYGQTFSHPPVHVSSALSQQTSVQDLSVSQQQQQQQNHQSVQPIPHHHQNMQQSHGAPQHQVLQQAQPLQNQQQQQQKIPVPLVGQQMQMHHQHAMNHSMSAQPQQQQQHRQTQVPGQHIVPAPSASSLPRPETSHLLPGDSAPAVQQTMPPPTSNHEGGSAVVDRSSGLIGHDSESTLEIQYDGQSDVSAGALGGLPVDQGYDETGDVDKSRSEELRKLDEDFKKTLMRAKKVFVNRMDNLQRTQVEREARHKKTLEQHQKDRAAFEKRLQQEEIEQNRRIEQMQKEWDRRREEVRLKQQSDDKSLSSTPPTSAADGLLSDTEALAPSSGLTSLDSADPLLPDW